MLPTIFVLLAGILWSFSGVLIKEIHWNAFAIAGTRSIIGGTLEFAFLVVAARALLRRDRSCGSMPSLLDSALHVLRRLFVPDLAHWLGALSFMLNMITLVFAFQLTSVATAVFLHYSGIVLIGLLSWPILKQSLSKADWFAVAGALAGIAVLSIDGARATGWTGAMLGIFCGITMAITQICLGLRAKETKSGFQAIETIVLANLLMALIAIPSILTAPLPVDGQKTWILLGALGIVPWAIPDMLYATGIKQVPVFRATILGLSDPILTALWPLVFLNEVPSTYAIIGAMIVLAAIVYQAKNSAKTSQSYSTAEVLFS